MNQVYFSPLNWPQPYHYQQWFEQLTEEQTLNVLNPTYYTQVYTYTIQNQGTKGVQSDSKPKLSRHQKRKMKKQKLEEELER